MNSKYGAQLIRRHKDAVNSTGGRYEKGLTLLIAGITLLAGLTILVRLAAQEPQNESATTVIANPVPLINQPLVPDAIRPGGAGFMLTVNGTGFVSGSVVKWNGSARATTFVSNSRLAAKILSSDIAKPSTAAVTVVNPAPGGGTSNVVFFEATIPSASVGLALKSNPSTGDFPISFAVGDFNRDGRLDLAVANLNSNSVSVLLGKGDGTFQAAVNYNVGSSPYSIAVGDLNADGNLDLVVANSSGNDVSVLLGRGNGTFGGAVNYSTGVASTPLSVGQKPATWPWAISTAMADWIWPSNKATSVCSWATVTVLSGPPSTTSPG